jgi:hypothetical protein
MVALQSLPQPGLELSVEIERSMCAEQQSACYPDAKSVGRTRLRPLGGLLVKWSIHHQCSDHLYSLGHRRRSSPAGRPPEMWIPPGGQL